MSKIKILAAHEAHKIAAGQVVERPANVIKELIENSLDAEASRITLYLEDGGKQLIRIIDNGHGMDQEDAQLCIAKHATSKIRSLNDLSSIHSYGFRGEALASIAAVSTITLLTKERETHIGTKMVCTNQTAHLEPVACPDGTDITITNLFHMVPARAKFLKARETELRHAVQTIHAMSLAYPAVHFQLFVDQKLVYNYPPQATIRERFVQIGGPETEPHMLALESTAKNDLRIDGVISNHAWFRYDRKNIFFLVNKRWVSNHHLSRALVKGYDNVIPLGRYPAACISITIDPAQIDINTHPKKEEIVFEHPRIVEQQIHAAVRSTLEKHVSQQIRRTVSFVTSFPSTICNPSTPFPHQSAPMIPDPFLPKSLAKIQPPLPEEKIENSKRAVDLQQKVSDTIQDTEEPHFRLIGQLNKTYLLLEQKDGLYLIDQHAAHERILYELFSKRFQEIPTINLMFPQIISCSPHDLQLFIEHGSFFVEQGMVIEPFGKDQLMIQSTPVHLKNISFKELIQQFIGWIQEYHELDKEHFIKTMHDKLRAQMACKAAVKAGNQLSHEQMQELLTDLYACPNRFSCPHGRPTGWLLSGEDIERRFRRR